MSDFLSGIEVSDRLHALSARIDALEAGRLAHEMEPGAHAAAFEAHNQSAGAVEEAEQLAGEILATATHEAEIATEAATDVAEEVAAATAEAITDALEAGVETAESPLEAINEGAGEGGGDEVKEEPPHEDPIAEREPSREHPLHRRIGGKGGE